LVLPALKCLKVSHNPRLSSPIQSNQFPALEILNVDGTQIQFDEVPKVREFITSQKGLISRVSLKCISASRAVGFAEMTGLRQLMEDSILVSEDVEPGVSLFGVFDGHGGPRTAIYAANAFLNSATGKDLTAEWLKAAFHDIDELVRGLVLRDGATAVVAVRRVDRIITGHLGDARLVVLRDDGSVKFQTEDHKPPLRSEYERVRDAGSKIVGGRIAGILAVTRSLGDFSVPGVCKTPDISEVPLEPSDRWLVIGCDGVWDVVFDKLLGNIAVAERSAAEFAADLRNTAYALGSLDNISVIVVDLKGEAAAASDVREARGNMVKYYIRKSYEDGEDWSIT
jgi:serine/threonine protein phosphatase PrpC